MTSRQHYRWFIVKAVLTERYRLVTKWTLYDYLELSSPNGLIMLAKDNKIRREYMALILQQFGIDMTEFDGLYDEMTSQMRDSSSSIPRGRSA